MARAARLARAHADNASGPFEVSDAETDNLAVSTPGQERTLHKRTERGFAGVDESPRLGVIEIADLRCACFTKRFHPAPSFIARGMPLAEGEVQRGLEHAQDSVGARTALAHSIRILEIDFADVPPFRRLAGPQTGRCLGEGGMPLPYQCRRQPIDFVSSELQPYERISGDFEAIERLPAAAFVIGDVVVEAAVDGVGSSFAFGIERGEPVSRVGLGLRVVEDALAIRIERVIGRAERRLTSSLAGRSIVPLAF